MMQVVDEVKQVVIRVYALLSLSSADTDCTDDSRETLTEVSTTCCHIKVLSL